KDQEEALNYYTTFLGFSVVEDQLLGTGKRWLVVAPSGDTTFGFILALAKEDRQLSRVGDQTGGKVLSVLHTDSFDEDLKRLTDNKVRIVRGPVEEAWGKVIVFEDLYGNLWDLVGR
ncbi:MAG: VOC family protein, partial [Flavobacteriales bacterium]